MKLIVQKSSLEVAVKNLVKVIDSKTSLPILTNILFDVNETAKTATLTASDSEVTMNCEVILSECEGGGRFCVGAQTLAEMLTERVEQPLVITATLESDMKFTVNFKDGSAYCPIIIADDYPVPVQGEYTETLYMIDGDFICDALKRSLWATADDELRAVMNGVNFALADGHLDIVASNGHVIVKSRSAAIADVGLNRIGSFIMPKKVAKIISGILKDCTVDIDWNDRQARIHAIGCEVIFQLIEGKYPNYNSVIPREYAHEVGCMRVGLLSAVKAVAPFTPESSQLMLMTFDGEELELRGDDFALSEGAVKSVLIEGYESNPLYIGAKASSIINMLSKFSAPEVLLKLNDPRSCIVIESIDEGKERKEEIIGAVMPMIID